jgi:acyl homoserine lactone synthase
LESHDVIVVLEKHNAEKFADLIDEMFRLRALVFHDRLHWDVRVTDSKERDKYDDEHPVYIIDTDDEARQVKGSLRLLPTTGPTLLADVFSDTLPDAIHLSAPTIWECSRLCLNEALLGRGRTDEKVFACARLLNGLADVAITAGIVSIVGNFDASMLRLYRLLGCEVEILGTSDKHGEPVYLGIHHISQPIVRRVNQQLEERGLVRGRLHNALDRRPAVTEEVAP